MNFNQHLTLEGQHAFLGASKYHWINYDSEKLATAYKKFLATQRGTELHAFASKCVKLGIALPKSKAEIKRLIYFDLGHKSDVSNGLLETLRNYINDAISYNMTAEQPLYYSENCFGTADAICFENNFLRIHDLKTGENPTSMSQLMVYAALFCLEYHMDPQQVEMELRIYQSNTINVSTPDPDEIIRIIGKIVEFDKIISRIKESE